MRNKLIALSLSSSAAGCALLTLAPHWNVDLYFMIVGVAAAVVAALTPKNAKS